MHRFEEMESFVLEDVTGFKDSNTESRFAGISTEGWEINTIGNNHEMIDDEKKGEIIQNTLLAFHLNREMN
jgi:hypothetical protein